MVLLLMGLKKKLQHFNGHLIVGSMIKSAIAAGAMWLVVYFFTQWSESTWDMFNKVHQIVQVVVGVVLGAGVYGLVALILKMDEVQMVTGIINRKLKRKRKAA